MTDPPAQRPADERGQTDPRHLHALLRIEQQMVRARDVSSRRRAIVAIMLHAVLGTMVGIVVALLVLPLSYVISAPAAFLVLVAAFSLVGALFGYLRTDTG